MEFVQQNIMWVALAVFSGGMLLWPMLVGGTVAHLTPAEATLMMNREERLIHFSLAAAENKPIHGDVQETGCMGHR